MCCRYGGGESNAYILVGKFEEQETNWEAVRYMGAGY
jgi:hypothetical protein